MSRKAKLALALGALVLAGLAIEAAFAVSVVRERRASEVIRWDASAVSADERAAAEPMTFAGTTATALVWSETPVTCPRCRSLCRGPIVVSDLDSGFVWQGCIACMRSALDVAAQGSER